MINSTYHNSFNAQFEQTNLVESKISVTISEVGFFLTISLFAQHWLELSENMSILSVIVLLCYNYKELCSLYPVHHCIMQLCFALGYYFFKNEMKSVLDSFSF